MFSGIGGMLFGGMLGALLFRSLGFSGDSDWGKEVFAFGDLFILLILLTLAFLVFRHFRNRSARPLTAAGPGAFTEPAMAYTALPASDPPPALPFPALAHIRSTDPAFSEPDFLSFAREVFTRVQERWAQRDVKGLRPLLSPEMAALFEKDLARLIAEKKINRIEDIRIRKAEISDALQDRGEDLITVKLDVLLHDCTVDEKSGQVLAGDSREPISFSEYWTFSRTIGEGNWVVAGISQDSAQ
jgi:predicted lipid-binding transport protein (Tim44 family)